MRLIDVDKLLKDIHDSGNTYEAWIYECILNQEVIDQEKEIEKVKADLCKILDSYCSPIRFIDAPKMDVDKFKEAMSRVRATKQEQTIISINPEMVNIGILIQGLRGWIEENSLYYDGKDSLDKTKKTLVNRPKMIPLSELNKLIAVANENL